MATALGDFGKARNAQPIPYNRILDARMLDHAVRKVNAM